MDSTSSFPNHTDFIKARSKGEAFVTPEIYLRFKLFEGCIPHMYLDGPGNVTIGIGCAILSLSSALVLEFYKKVDNTKATYGEITEEYNLLKNASPNHGVAYYDKFCKLYLTRSEIDRLFFIRITQIIDFLDIQFPEFNDLDSLAKQVVVDMGFNMGVGKLLHGFPNFLKYLKAHDYKSAAAHCHRKGIQESRNKWAFDTLVSIKPEVKNVEQN